jgi:hypothetical protein
MHTPFASQASRLCILAYFLIFGNLAFSQNVIKEAFGMPLGAKWSPSKAIGSGSLTDGTPMYQFSPTKKFRSFDRYFVLLTPKTNRIYGIWAMGKCENSSTGKKERAVIMTLLEKKYGSKEKSGLIATLYDAKQITQGSRSVLVKVSGMFDTSIEIRYTDSDLSALAEKERIEIEASKVDDSGL